MTKLRIVETSGTTFNDLEPGDIFTFEEGGLFMKVPPNKDWEWANAIVVVAGGPADKDYVQAGSFTGWGAYDKVKKITELLATARS